MRQQTREGLIGFDILKTQYNLSVGDPFIRYIINILGISLFVVDMVYNSYECPSFTCIC